MGILNVINSNLNLYKVADFNIVKTLEKAFSWADKRIQIITAAKSTFSSKKNAELDGSIKKRTITNKDEFVSIAPESGNAHQSTKKQNEKNGKVSTSQLDKQNKSFGGGGLQKIQEDLAPFSKDRQTGAKIREVDGTTLPLEGSTLSGKDASELKELIDSKDKEIKEVKKNCNVLNSTNLLILRREKIVLKRKLKQVVDQNRRANQVSASTQPSVSVEEDYKNANSPVGKKQNEKSGVVSTSQPDKQNKYSGVDSPQKLQEGLDCIKKDLHEIRQIYSKIRVSYTEELQELKKQLTSKKEEGWEIDAKLYNILGGLPKLPLTKEVFELNTESKKIKKEIAKLDRGIEVLQSELRVDDESTVSDQ